MKNRIHEKICARFDTLVDWYASHTGSTYVPIYSSYDIRDGGFKLGNVDGNIFPAGFNNICQTDKESAPEVFASYMEARQPNVKKILLLTEDHLKNLYYWENVHAIRSILMEAGFEIQVGMLSPEAESVNSVTSFMGNEVPVSHVTSDGGQLRTKDFVPDLVISNNDFSLAYGDVDFSKTKIVPARELGWYQRKKSRYFQHYNTFAKEFADLIEEDPWLFSVPTEIYKDLDVSVDTSREALAQKTDNMLETIRAKYDQYGVEDKPFVVIKNNAGTYGLAVTKVQSGEEVLSWNYKAKKKMKAAKGGRDVGEVILQEGVPTILKDETATAEPAIYMVGTELVGGFLRTHNKKDDQESLNSPGAVYKRLCLSDLKVRVEGCVLENVYGWVAKLGLLAIAEEAKDLGIQR